MKMRKLSFLLFVFWQVCLFAGNYEVLSPDGKLKVALMVSDVLIPNEKTLKDFIGG